jgi:YebC/PmpR family DNA-binding regulatory protein
MSGHSKWAQIKRSKAIVDAKRGSIFTKLGRNITIAVKTGGGVDPIFNFKLRMAIDRAKEAGMPKDNIERALKKGAGEGKEAIAEVTVEGYGPAGSAFIIEAITDNTNRTTQNIRTIFSKNHGRMGEQGSVMWMFESKGQILVEKQKGTENLSLDLIDQGVEDVKETKEGLEIYTLPVDLEKTKKFIESNGLKVLSSELIMRPQESIELSNEDLKKVQLLIDALNDDDDVVNVHNNVNF